MYNKAILSEQIKRFGAEAAEKFCEMEAFKYQLIAQSLPHGNEQSENLYERDWWQTEKENLTELIIKNVKNDRQTENGL
jgi:hypothetical protein